MKMKFFSKKKAPEKQDSSSVETSGSAQSLYTKSVGDAPLNEFSEGHGRTIRRTSLHSPARRRETSNRASNREVLFLLFRTGLIIGLLAGGFLALKLVLSRLAEPSEKEKQRWETNAVLMEKGEASDILSAEISPGQQSVQVLNAELIEKRLKMWEEAERHFRSAEALNQRGMDEESAARLGQMLRAAPNSRSGQQLLMEIYMRSGNYAQAVPLCIRLLDQDSQQWDVKMALLQALQKLNQTEACLVLADQMLENEPNSMGVLQTAALAHHSAGDIDGALDLFARMLNNDSRNLAALEGSGAIYQERGEWKKAISYYLELVRTDPRVEYYHELARCYARQEEAGKAVIFMGQAASLFGDAEVSSWLRYDLESFDPIRETVEYRSFADRLVGVETRKAIEEIRKREVQRQAPVMPAGLDQPTQPSLQLKPSR
ncbi:MAG: tetratricopeptide repeat protein [Verrucomicrobia bacterium]|nr:tetratricopeptide repeat protein [Verrucomicrobiota bacterium]